ncbi:MAG: hypothetical protein DWQ04_18955 [Chloroflexi bacterium]|nr:MAG: hypothetical protein DWQ04_18955 [Chloroflexota bacterium]
MLRRFVILVLLVLSPIFIINYQGHEGTAVAAPPHNEEKEAPTDNVYYIALNVPSVDSYQINLPFGPEGVETAVWQALKQESQPIVNELEQLQMRQLISGYELQQGTNSVAVYGVSDAAHLQTLNQTASVYQNELPKCAIDSAQAMQEQIAGLMQTQSMKENAVLNRVTAVPSIIVQTVPKSNYSSVNGYADGNKTVTMNLIRNGQTVATQSTTSSSNGFYYFSPSWQSCPFPDYSWQAKTGDVVQVSANGQTASTTVVDISLSVDPITNIASGTTAPGRTVVVNIYQPQNGICSGTSQSKQTTAASGNYNLDFSSLLNFNRAASGQAYAKDGNGNSTYTYAHAHTIYAYFNSYEFAGVISPSSSYTAKLQRSGSTLDMVTGSSSGNGYFNDNFSYEIEPGDIIQLSGSNFTNFQYTAVDLTTTFNINTNQLTGTTASNRTVSASFNKRSNSYDVVTTTCSYGYDCESTTSNSSGNYTLNASIDIERGDYAYVYVYDTNGMYQYTSGGVNAPAIVATPNSSQIKGLGTTPYTYVSITLKNSSGIVKDSATDYSDYEGEFYEWMNTTVYPGDIIEINDGSTTTSMTVQNTDTYLNSSTDRLNGTASGKLLALLWDYDAGFYWNDYCASTNATGSVNLAFSSANIDGQDYAKVYNTGADGHYTYQYIRAFTVNAEFDYDSVYGYTTHRQDNVTIQHKRNSTVLETITETSSTTNGFFYVFLSNSFQTGDVLVVTSSQGDSTTLTVPTLTVSIPQTGDKITGTGPANQKVFVLLSRLYNNGSYGWGFYETVNASGNYSVSLDDGYDYYWGYDCSAVEVQGHCNRALTRHYTSNGHQFVAYSPYPDDAPADNYENDNASSSAKAYSSTQSHSFHTSSDTDWVKFTVTNDDLGKTYYIETRNLGWGMDTILYLYDTDGTTQLAWNDDGGAGLASLIAWQPTASGTYYVRVDPYDNDNTAYCDALYDLSITTNRIFLPIVGKQ